jgi:hypothetical protein
LALFGVCAWFAARVTEDPFVSFHFDATFPDYVPAGREHSRCRSGFVESIALPRSVFVLTFDPTARNLSLHEYLTVPPAEGDASGPPPEVVDLFLEYMTALHEKDEDKAKKLLGELNTHRKAKDRAEQQKKAKHGTKRGADVSIEELDRQILEDLKLLKLFGKADLESLCKHHGLESKGTIPTLKNRLLDHYAAKREQ